MELHLKITGLILVILAIVHGVFPRHFHWQKELSSLSLVNKQMMYVHTFFIALVILLMGLLCLTSSKELIETNLGKRICLGLSVFWIIRLVIQFFGNGQFIWAWIVGACISLFDAFTVAPMLSAYLAKSDDHVKGKGPVGRMLSAFDRFQTKLEDIYETSLRWTVGHRKTVLGSALIFFLRASFTAGATNFSSSR